MDGLKAAFERMEGTTKGESSNDNSSSGGEHEDNPGELHSIHHHAHEGKHHVTSHGSRGVEHSSHEDGEEKGDCPLCGK
jgi:hypothetical protein